MVGGNTLYLICPHFNWKGLSFSLQTLKDLLFDGFYLPACLTSQVAYFRTKNFLVVCIPLIVNLLSPPRDRGGFRLSFQILSSPFCLRGSTSSVLWGCKCLSWNWGTYVVTKQLVVTLMIFEFYINLHIKKHIWHNHTHGWNSYLSLLSQDNICWLVPNTRATGFLGNMRYLTQSRGSCNNDNLRFHIQWVYAPLVKVKSFSYTFLPKSGIFVQ